MQYNAFSFEANQNKVNIFTNISSRLITYLAIDDLDKVSFASAIDGIREAGCFVPLGAEQNQDIIC